MKLRHALVFMPLASLLISGCAVLKPAEPTPDINAALTVVAGEIASTQTAVAAIATSTPTPTATPTVTPSPTPTPEPGTAQNPAPVGSSFTLNLDIYPGEVINVTYLEAYRGEEADQIARNNLGVEWYSLYKEPTSEQEYVAAKMKIDFLKGDTFQEKIMYTFWSSSCVNINSDYQITSKLNIINITDRYNGYIPFSYEEWMYCLVRKGSRPTILFSPYIDVGAANQLVFFSLPE